MVAHLRNRGYAEWVPSATSEKGSYRLADVIAFMEKHLPREHGENLQHGEGLGACGSEAATAAADARKVRKWEGPWRILMADDHAPHRADAVRRLAWHRGWVMIVHGGGTTPVAQPVDTDLNQHVKRHYMALESARLLQKMQDGAVVPRLSQDECIDLMVQVLQDVSLHENAALGFKKTGIRVAFDGKEDSEICREALAFWEERGLRENIDREVAFVEDEINNGRLRWCYNDIHEKLIRPYEKRKKTDAILQVLGEETLGDEDEGRNGGHESEADSDSAGSMEGWDAEVRALDADEGALDEGQAPGLQMVPTAAPPVSADAALEASRSSGVLSALEASEEALREVGQLEAAQKCRRARDVEVRRQRLLAREDPNLVQALDAQRRHEAGVQAERRRQVQEANARTKTLQDIKRQIREADAQRLAAKALLKDAQDATAAMHYVHNVSVHELRLKKNRMDVLHRLKDLKGALSPEQKFQFAWWKDAWDDWNSRAHKKEWPAKFAGMLQKVSNDMVGGDGEAFSKFVRDEQTRCLSDAVALSIPATAAL